VEILTTPDARLCRRVRLTQARDVDEQAIPDVDPAGIDHILAVPTHALDVVRVHVEEVLALDLGAVIGHKGVVVHGHVEVLAQPGQSPARDLDVEIPVPGHDLAVPPPAQQGAVGDPGLNVALAKADEVGADEVVEGIGLFLVGDGLAPVVADIIVAQGIVEAGLVEVLGVSLFDRTGSGRGGGEEEEGGRKELWEEHGGWEWRGKGANGRCAGWK